MSLSKSTLKQHVNQAALLATLACSSLLLLSACRSGACEIQRGMLEPLECEEVSDKDACERDDSLRGGRDPGRTFHPGATCASLGYEERAGARWKKRTKQ